jgi:hypothetical protein
MALILLISCVHPSTLSLNLQFIIIFPAAPTFIEFIVFCRNSTMPIDLTECMSESRNYVCIVQHLKVRKLCSKTAQSQFKVDEM